MNTNISHIIIIIYLYLQAPRHKVYELTLIILCKNLISPLFALCMSDLRFCFTLERHFNIAVHTVQHVCVHLSLITFCRYVFIHAITSSCSTPQSKLGHMPTVLKKHSQHHNTAEWSRTKGERPRSCVKTTCHRRRANNGAVGGKSYKRCCSA